MGKLRKLMDYNHLEFFKYMEEEPKLLVFNILRELPTDVHLPILTILDQHEEQKIIEAIETETIYSYESSEYSDPEEEYQRRLIKQINRWEWNYYYSGNETD